MVAQGAALEAAVHSTRILQLRALLGGGQAEAEARYRLLHEISGSTTESPADCWTLVWGRLLQGDDWDAALYELRRWLEQDRRIKSRGPRWWLALLQGMIPAAGTA